MGVLPGCFFQDEAETAPGSSGENRRIIDLIEAEVPTALVPRVRDMLGAFLFQGDDVYKSPGVLSGGERSRLALLRMLLKPLNLLVLDEPTNHLDLQSKDILLEALKKFQGTIIFVSHDRAFMEALSTKTLELSPSAEGPARPRLFYGNYAYYLDRIAGESGGERGGPAQNTAAEKAAPLEKVAPPEKAEALPEAAVPAEPSPRALLVKAGQARPPTAGERREQEKQKQTLSRRLRRQEEEILAALEMLETEKTRLEGELARPEIYTGGEKVRFVQARLKDLAAGIEAKTREWEDKAGELERFSRSGGPDAESPRVSQNLS
jgi:ATP-binding cassette subfamily F protein 3